MSDEICSYCNRNLLRAHKTEESLLICKRWRENRDKRSVPRTFGDRRKAKQTNSLIKSAERVKALGEVFTPPALVTEMLNKLPQECWEHTKTFLEPACGTGNFLVQIVQRKIEAGSTPLQALATTFGIDIMADNVNESRRRLIALVKETGSLDEYQVMVANWLVCCNIVRGNALEGTMEDKFWKAREQRILRMVLQGDPLYFQNPENILMSGLILEYFTLPLLEEA